MNEQNTNKRAREAYTTLIEKSIAAKTLQQYQSRIDTLQEFLVSHKLTTLTARTFALFLTNLLDKTGNPCKSTAEGYRSAIIFFQEKDGLWEDIGEPHWASSMSVKRLVEGYGHNGKKVMVRGQVGEELFAELLIWIDKNYPNSKHIFQIAYLCALRPHQLFSLRKGSYDPDEELLTLPDKRCNSKNKFPMFCKKFVAHPQARTLLQACETELSPTGKYWDLTLAAFRKIFKEAVTTLKWEERYPGLSFDGPHTLRHGGMSHLTNVLEDIYTTEETRTILQVTKNTQERYCKKNETRVLD